MYAQQCQCLGPIPFHQQKTHQMTEQLSSKHHKHSNTGWPKKNGRAYFHYPEPKTTYTNGWMIFPEEK
jgi:hypothetical protein